MAHERERDALVALVLGVAEDTQGPRHARAVRTPKGDAEARLARSREQRDARKRVVLARTTLGVAAKADVHRKRGRPGRRNAHRHHPVVMTRIALRRRRRRRQRQRPRPVVVPDRPCRRTRRGRDRNPAVRALQRQRHRLVGLARRVAVHPHVVVRRHPVGRHVGLEAVVRYRYPGPVIADRVVGRRSMRRRAGQADPHTPHLARRTVEAHRHRPVGNSRIALRSLGGGEANRRAPLREKHRREGKEFPTNTRKGQGGREPHVLTPRSEPHPNVGSLTERMRSRLAVGIHACKRATRRMDLSGLFPPVCKGGSLCTGAKAGVVVADLVAVQPVDGNPGAGQPGVVPGAHRRGRPNHPELRGVRADGRVPGGGPPLHEAVVDRDVARLRMALRGRDEEQTELAAGPDARRLQRPVVGNRVRAVGVGRRRGLRLSPGQAHQAGQQRQNRQQQKDRQGRKHAQAGREYAHRPRRGVAGALMGPEGAGRAGGGAAARR